MPFAKNTAPATSPPESISTTMKFAVSPVLLATAIAALSVPGIDAKPEFVKLIPNAALVPDAPAIGHKDNTGASSANNDFGRAFDDAGKVWTLELCKADTDGDGQTNGQELGDPCCEWSVGSKPRWSSGYLTPAIPRKPPTRVCGPASTARTSPQSMRRLLPARHLELSRWGQLRSWAWSPC
ncbi:unnamed protein product [Phytophthora lilii]|uniref:Unnamed protein product n=1 Tax=Phytophthora lilii TaxID=2077276 RepID=A0A9W6TL99_9STRA|nr:unnamed protein product [Phytophthora lilii]